MKIERYWVPTVICFLQLVSPALATDFTWKGGNGNWSNPAKWTPASGPPEAGDSAAILGGYNSQPLVTLSADVLGTKSPSAVSIGDQGKLDTNGFRMRVDGDIHAFGAGTSLNVRPVAADSSLYGLEGTDLVVNPSSQVKMLGGKAKVKKFQLSNGTLWFDGQGTMRGTENVFIGDGIGSQDAEVKVLSVTNARIEGPVSFQGDAEVDIFNNSTLQLANQTTFYGGGHYVGTGLLQFDGASTRVFGNTTIDMPNGKVDLDGTETLLAAGQSLILTADLTVNASAIDTTGNQFGSKRLVGEDTIQISNWGKLAVNLTDPNSAWTMNGHLDIDTVTGQLIAHNIAGSDMLLTGTASVSGNSGWSARTDVAGTITIEADSHLRLSGGDMLNPSRLVGGVIQGAGTLGNLADDALVGYGQIHTKIQFLTNTELRADDGTLTLGPTSDILAVNIIGTNDADGILEVQKPWYTGVAETALELKGGEVVGAAITNTRTTRGFGRIGSESFDNQGSLIPIGGELVIDTAQDPDLDGPALLHVGTIDASNGSLRVTRPLSDKFGTQLTVGPGQTATFEQGWVLDGGPFPATTGTLHLNGGNALESAATVAGGAQVLGGIVNVNGEAAFDAGTTFDSAAQVNIPAAFSRLRLYQPTTVKAGALFAGSGQLVNGEGNPLTLEGGAQVDVTVSNAGTLAVVDTIDDAEVRALQNSATSNIALDIRGKTAVQYGTLKVIDNAYLDGDVTVEINEGGGNYVEPTDAGEIDSFTLLAATDVVGRFSGLTYDGVALPMSFSGGNKDRFHGGAGLFHVLQYHPTGVQLLNYRALVGDADGNGSFDSSDLVTVFQAGEYEDGIGDNSDWTEGDWNGDLDFDSGDFVAAFQLGNYEQPSVLPAVSALAVPEATTMGLLWPAAAGIVCLFRRRTKP